MTEVESELDNQLQKVLVYENYGFFIYAGVLNDAKSYIEDISKEYSTLEVDIVQVGNEEFGVIVKNKYRTQQLSAVG